MLFQALFDGVWVESDALSLERKRKGQGGVGRVEYARGGTGRKVWGWGSPSWT